MSKKEQLLNELEQIKKEFKEKIEKKNQIGNGNKRKYDGNPRRQTKVSK